MADPNDHKARNASTTSPRTDPLKTPVRSRSDTISVKTDSKSFDVFLSSIAKVQSLTEAKRLRNDVDREIRALKNTASVPTSDDHRLKEEAHLKRLERARRKIDKRIDRLQGKSPSVSSPLTRLALTLAHFCCSPLLSEREQANSDPRFASRAYFPSNPR